MYKTNILPKSSRKLETKLAKRRRKDLVKSVRKSVVNNISYGATLFALSVLVAVGLSFMTSKEIKTLEAERTELSKEVEAHRNNIDKLEIIRKEQDEITQGLEKVKVVAHKNSIHWDIIVDEIAASTPQEVVIDVIEERGLSKQGVAIEITAKSFEIEGVSRLTQSLKENNNFSGVEFFAVKQPKVRPVDDPQVKFYKIIGIYKDTEAIHKVTPLTKEDASEVKDSVENSVEAEEEESKE